ncbi:MAG: hypothetical protein K9L59_15505 [Desulfobacterales bacterium]|nr:hypothetical protein [Desulfobacterales bacterium]MCF8081281.1 hypothetical protein [Desulfobacterales bacterium]
MDSRKISSQDRQCIAGCIFKYYGSSDVSADDERHEKSYEQCLESCRIC